MKKGIYFISLGCQKNLVDSENILGLINEDEFEIIDDPRKAKYIFINTCGFIEDAKKESIDTIFEMLQYENAKVIVMGCLVERYYDALKEEIPEVVSFIRVKDYFRIGEILNDLDEGFTTSRCLDFHKRTLTTDKFTSFLKISDGCDNCCTYCAIPLIRGRFKSRGEDELLEEAHLLENKGVKELVVISQDTTKYGIDQGYKTDITKLLKRLLNETNFLYIRLLYLYPDEISDELIDLIGHEKRLTPYFDIPIQHSESAILKRMNRRGDKKLLLDLFNKIKERVPNAILRTTIMLGFPGETEEDFDNLITFIKEIKFDHLGAFTYSREEDTPAYDMVQVDEDIKKKRFVRLMKVQKDISLSKNKEQIGKVMDGLVVGSKKDYYLVRSYWNAPDDIDGFIYLRSDKELNLGDEVRIKIVDAKSYDLYAEITD